MKATAPPLAAAGREHARASRLSGKEGQDVKKNCTSEGWVRVPAGKTVDRKGRPLLIKLKGQVEAFYR